MTCPKCNFQNPEEVNICQQCKVALEVSQPQLKHGSRRLIMFTLISVIISAGLFFLLYLNRINQRNSDKIPEKIPETADTNKSVNSFSSSFAQYTEISVNISPKVASYSISSDLSNISNKADFKFSPQAQQFIVKNGFVVNPAQHPEFFLIYETNKDDYVPSFITTDSMLHSYHLMFDYLLRNLEEEKLNSELKNLNANMLSETSVQYNALKGTQWENAAKRNLGFFAVGSKLLDPELNIPKEVETEAAQELAFIEAHQGINESPVMNIGIVKDVVIDTPQGRLGLEASKEDYSQYVPRGHYTKSDQLKKYFLTMMWYGRLTFRFKNEDEIKSALLITMGLKKEENRVSWNKIYEPINFFVGKSDDITYYQLTDLLAKAYGGNATIQLVTTDNSKFALFVESAKSIEPPQINSVPIFNAAIQPNREEEIKGFRFMGQRFTIDASIFQRLIDPEVPDRMLPKGLDVPAAMGSAEALNILSQMGETRYRNYSENMEKMKLFISGLPAETWTQNLYWGWLYALQPLLAEKPEGYPSFMRNLSWARKELNTFLGSWTELKRDTILYAKEPTGGGAGGYIPEEKDIRGYVEPNPYVYARLASLLKMTREGLESRSLLNDDNTNSLGQMEQLALSLKIISEKELNNEKLTDEEYELIRSYGGKLFNIWWRANPEVYGYLDKSPAMIVADVASNPSQVLEEATGYIYEIYVVVPIDGKLSLVKGGAYSYYEFIWPVSERLTDGTWKELLSSSKAPALPKWVSIFLVK